MNIGIVITFTISANVCYKQYTHIPSIAKISKHTDVSSDMGNTTSHISQNGGLKRMFSGMSKVPVTELLPDILAEKSRVAARNINSGLQTYR